jgi:hypothetical protein
MVDTNATSNTTFVGAIIISPTYLEQIFNHWPTHIHTTRIENLENKHPISP